MQSEIESNDTTIQIDMPRAYNFMARTNPAVYQTPVAASKSPTRGRVKIPQVRRQDQVDC